MFFLREYQTNTLEEEEGILGAFPLPVVKLTMSLCWTTLM